MGNASPLVWYQMEGAARYAWCSFFVSGEISLSRFLNRPFLAFLPSSTDHLINSCSSGEFNLFNNFFACFLLSVNKVLINLDQFTQENLDISDFIYVIK